MKRKHTTTLTAIFTAFFIYAATTFFSSAIAACGTWQVPCYQWNTATQKWDCNCQYFWCSSGWQEGACPVGAQNLINEDDPQQLSYLLRPTYSYLSVDNVPSLDYINSGNRQLPYNDDSLN